MEKLSIEEKAKAYDDAIKKAKKDLQVCEQDCLVAKQIFRYFPELAKPEDEKVREEIIAVFKGETSYTSEEDAKRYIAWLEKQNSNVDNANKEYWRGYREGKQEILDKYAELEKQGEQKASCTTIVETGNGGINALVTRELPTNGCDEQKPAWSEEDENTIKVLMNIIRKSEMIDSIIYTDSLKEKLYDWLKSLRPQNNWKPSDEQMKQLGWIAEQNKDNMIGKELISLYQDLKKLREE